VLTDQRLVDILLLLSRDVVVPRRHSTTTTHLLVVVVVVVSVEALNTHWFIIRLQQSITFFSQEYSSI